MKKLSLMVFAILAFLGTFSMNASIHKVAQLGEPVEFDGNDTYYTITLQSDGILTFTTASSSSRDGIFSMNKKAVNLVYTRVNDEPTPQFLSGDAVPPMDDFEITGNYVTKESFELKGDTEYYIYLNGTVTLDMSFVSTAVADPKDSAVDIQLNNTPVQLGGDNKVGKIVIEEDGILSVVAATNPYNVAVAANGGFLKDSEDNGINSVQGGVSQTGWFQNSENESYYTQYSLEAGTYYVYYNSASTNIFTFSFQPLSNVTVSVTAISLTPGNVWDTENTTNHNGFTVTFDPDGTTIGSASIQYLVNGETQTATIPFEDVRNAMWNIGGNDGSVSSLVPTMDKNSEFQIILSGVNWNGKALSASNVDSDYVKVDNGTLTITFLAPGDPVDIVSQSWPTSISSYMAPGNENGVATITFNYPMQSLSATLLFYSNYLLGSQVEVPGQIDLPVTIDGETATINFTNIDFTKVEGYTPLSSYSIIIAGMKTTTGMSYGSFVKTIAYNADASDEAADEMTTTPTVLTPGSQFVLDPVNPVITWDYAEISLTSDLNFAYLTVGAGAQQSCSLKAISVEGEDGVVPDYTNAIEIQLPAGLTATGLYSFTIPSNVVENTDGEVNAEYSFTYSNPPTNVQWQFVGLEENGEYAADDLAAVGVIWNFLADGQQLSEGISTEEITIAADGGEAVSVDATIGINEITLNLSDLEKGDYTLTIPKGYVWVGSTGINPLISVNFTVTESSAINSINDLYNGKTVIYNLNGVRVNGNNLSKGIYIINGKKVMVK